MKKNQLVKKIAKLEAELEELNKNDPTNKGLSELREKIKTYEKRLDRLS